jgi:beta-glucuronidase
MLYPQQNLYRNKLDLSGIWDFQVDPENIGERDCWQLGLSKARPIAVPGSWNEQYEEYFYYFGLAWYVKRTYVPVSWQGQSVFLRVGSACYFSTVYVNGRKIGCHEGGYLPFIFEITREIHWNKENTIAISVENELKPDRLPVAGINNPLMPCPTYPKTSYDYFPYSGIHRPVVLYSLPTTYIEDLTVNTDIQGNDGVVSVHVKLSQPNSDFGFLNLTGFGEHVSADLHFQDGFAKASLTVPDAKFWSDQAPHLYELTVSVESDQYHLPIGIRTIAVQDGRILLNGKPVKLNGFGRHEDFLVSGKGLNLPLLVKDYQLMKWVGANSYRTAHYPYSEEEMHLADREGLLIINEIPAVGLQFGGDASTDRLMQQCKGQLEALINRDKNHPSVVMWSVANEPLLTKPQSPVAGIMQAMAEKTGNEFLQELMWHVRQLDASRPVTFAAVGGTPLSWYMHCDVVCINRYFGWYVFGGELDKALEAFEEELESLWDALRKPVIVSELGADAVVGSHANPERMWTEEYQAKLIEGHLELAEKKDFVAGMQVWGFADFATGQSVMRVGGLNLKGVFTRTRSPKMAVYVLKRFWWRDH